VGDAAGRRGVGEPGRLARGFKRRFGDSTPVLLGGSPFSADGLTGRLVGWLVAAVAEREGGPAEAVAVTCPANWGPFKRDLLVQCLRLAGLVDAVVLSEPEAAAVFYASSERVEPGEVVAVYDLGGGTFDAAVLRKSAEGFVLLGAPEGVERLGGIDFDEAVVAHVQGFLGSALSGLDVSDPAVVAALARLRADCVEAKEALSADTDVSIPVLLPSVQTEIRLTRAEFESMIRPTLAETTAALGRALRSAGVAAEELAAVLLVGGSSRIPLVGQLVAAELGRPVAIDVHPKHAVAEGAALAAGRQLGMAEAMPAAPRRPKTATAPPIVAPPIPAPAPVAAAAPVAAGPVAAGPVAAGPVAAGPVAAGPVAAGPVAAGPVAAAAAVGGPPVDRQGGGRRNTLVIGGVLVAVIAIVAVLAAVLSRGSTAGGPNTAAGGAATTTPASTRSATTNRPASTTTVNVPPGATVAFTDNFSDIASGWAADANQEGAGTAEYRSDGYYLSALKPLPVLNTFSAKSPYAQRLTSMLVAADVTIVSGAAGDGGGVRCDQGSRAGLRYTFEVFRDGTWMIFKLGDAAVSLQTGHSPAIRTGSGANTVLGQCSEVNGGATKLIMTVNGVVLGTVTDPHPPGSIAWHAALTVYRSESSPATVVRFNNFRTLATSPA
jgi:actin-like ATPase involved in cell morphogenesis